MAGPLMVSNLDTIQLSAESQVGWERARWEIFAYPPDYATPAGWTLDADHALLFSTAPTPPLITLPASPFWGKWIPRLRVNEASDTANDQIDQNPSLQQLRDESSGWQIISPSGVLRDTGLQETTQFGGPRTYIGDVQLNWRALEAAIAGGEATGSASGDISGTYPGPIIVTGVHGATVPASGALVPGNILQVSGAASLAYGPINLAGGANYVTGLLPGANVAPNFAATLVASLRISALTAGVLHADGSGNVTSSLLVNADISASAAIAVSKLAPGTQFQALVAGAAGAPQWGTVNLGQAAALSGVGADARVPYAASGAFAFAAGLAFNSGTNVLTASGGLITGSLRATGLVGPGAVVVDASGNFSVGAGAGSAFSTLFYATVPAAEAAAVTGFPDQVRMVVQELHREYELNLAGTNAAGGTLAIDHTNYDVLDTPDPTAVWIARN